MNEFEKEYILTAEDPAFAEKLIDMLKKQMPEKRRIDPFVYEEICLSHKALVKLLKSNEESVRIGVGMNEAATKLCLTTEISELTVNDLELFVDVIGIADIFNIYPLENGNLKLMLIFEHAMIPI